MDRLMDRAVELGQSAMALTDHGNLFGTINFIKQAEKRRDFLVQSHPVTRLRLLGDEEITDPTDVHILVVDPSTVFPVGSAET